MLNVNQLIGFGSGESVEPTPSAISSLTYIGTTLGSGELSSYTFGNVSIGNETSTRHVIVQVNSEDVPSTFTINGSSARKITSASFSYSTLSSRTISFYVLKINNDDVANFTLTFPDTQISSVQISVYTAQCSGEIYLKGNASGTSISGIESLTVGTVTNGIAILGKDLYGLAYEPTPVTISGLTEYFDNNIIASAGGTTSGVDLTTTITFDSMKSLSNLLCSFKGIA